MKLYKNNTVKDILKPFVHLSVPENTIFLDIETTGLSADRNFIYCIGIAFMEHDTLTIWQWFAENREEEADILLEFLHFLQNNVQMLCTFNGKTFDIPFMKKRCRHHHLSFDISEICHRDLLQEIRPCRTLLSLPGLRQKDLETFLGIEREDLYDGGQLTEVYLTYEKTKAPDLLHLLRLHNYEDMEGMFRILPVLFYRRLTDGDFEIEAISCEESRSLQGQQKEMLSFHITYPFCLPRSTVLIKEQIRILLKEQSGIISLPVTAGDLKLFLPDYKNYYYLPEEDTVVHKSVGQFVDPCHRTAAKKENCFLKKNGVFLCGNIKNSQFRFQPEYRDNRKYMDISDFWDTGQTIDIHSISREIHEAFHGQIAYLLNHLKNMQ